MSDDLSVDSEEVIEYNYCEVEDIDSDFIEELSNKSEEHITMGNLKEPLKIIM